jgi:predicted outer membrane repeat protein
VSYTNIAPSSQSRAAGALLRRLPLSAALLACLCLPAHGATIVVDDASASPVEGHCTIVDAVAALNTQAAVNGCVAGDGNNDVIDMTGFGVPTMLTFTQSASGYSHALALSRAATIRGALDASGGPLVTLARSSISGTPAFGLIQTTAPLTVYGLALTNGSAPDMGGAIQSGAALTVDHCVVNGNHATGGGGLASTGTITLMDSTVSDNTAVYTGGGVISNTTVHLYHTTVSGNSTADARGFGGGGVYSGGAFVARNATITDNVSATVGGGVASESFVTINDSAVSNNSALGGDGGGVLARASGVAASGSTFNGNGTSSKGGAIYSTDTSLENTTVTGNVAIAGAGGVYTKTLLSDYATITGNRTNTGIGGGVAFASTASANGTIMYGNTPDDLNTPSQAALSGNFNLIGVSAWAVPSDTINCDPQLGALADNGGPTMTMIPAYGSCAIDAASASPTESTDQRGLPRPASGADRFRADIGAVERQASEDPEIIFASSFE